MTAADEAHHGHWQIPTPRIWSAVGILGLALCVGSISGCSAFGHNAADTCDGKKPVGSLEEASRGLVNATYAGDRDGICRVTAPAAGGPLSDQMVTDTAKILRDKGITPDNLQITVGEQFGSGVLVMLSDGSADPTHSLELFGTLVREQGFTIGLPAQVYPDEPSHPESSATTG